jgi:hypothetical protein
MGELALHLLGAALARQAATEAGGEHVRGGGGGALGGRVQPREAPEEAEKRGERLALKPELLERLREIKGLL